MHTTATTAQPRAVTDDEMWNDAAVHGTMITEQQLEAYLYVSVGGWATRSLAEQTLAPS